MVVISAKLRSWWKRFDAFGRKVIVYASPILGTGRQEENILSDLARKRAARDAEKNG
jgi:hypothetical protein